LERVTRRVDYIHLPVIPTHGLDDYAVFKDLQLPASAELYLGLINLADGLEGAKQRIAMAEKIIPSFGVASFCGLGRPPLADASGPSSHGHPPIPELRRATPDTIAEVLALHRQVALV
jgi:hypothetical protein